GDATPDDQDAVIGFQKVDKGEYVDTPEYADQIAREEPEFLEVAMGFSDQDLVRLLPKVRARNPHAGDVMAQALRKKDPALWLSVKLVKSVGDVTDVTPTIQSEGSTKRQSAGEGDTPLYQYAMLDLLDPAALASSDTLYVAVSETTKHMLGSDTP